MNKKLSRRAALGWMAVTATASLVACQKMNLGALETDQTAAPTADPTTTAPTSTPTATPSPAPTPAPSATATPALSASAQPESGQNPNQIEGIQMTAVYMTKEISADGLLKIYQSLGAATGRQASGKVAVKISSGEPGGHHFLSPDLIAPLVKTVTGTIVECNTAYGGGRADTTSHQQVLVDHGFTAIAPVDIMDADGELNLPITGGKHLTEDVVGAHFADYDFVLNLAHFKGHAMGGFGGVIKNMSIGIASSKGKSLIHSAGKETTGFGLNTPQDEFLESMAEAAKGVADYLGENILYINVLNNLSVDCDCDSHPAAPTMQDIGILASLDPVALDQACVDLVYAAPDGADLIARMESRHAIHTLEHAEAIGLGSRAYELVEIG